MNTYDIVFAICGYLNIYDVAKLSNINKTFYKVFTKNNAAVALNIIIGSKNLNQIRKHSRSIFKRALACNNIDTIKWCFYSCKLQLSINKEHDVQSFAEIVLKNFDNPDAIEWFCNVSPYKNFVIGQHDYRIIHKATICFDEALARNNKYLGYAVRNIIYPPSVINTLHRMCKIGNTSAALIAYNVVKATGYQIVPQQLLLYVFKKGHLALGKALCESDETMVHNITLCANYYFYKACKHGHLDVAKWIYKFNEINNDHLHISFWAACCKGHLEVAQWILTLSPINITLIKPNVENIIRKKTLRHVKLWLDSLQQI